MGRLLSLPFLFASFKTLVVWVKMVPNHKAWNVVLGCSVDFRVFAADLRRLPFLTSAHESSTVRRPPCEGNPTGALHDEDEWMSQKSPAGSPQKRFLSPKSD